MYYPELETLANENPRWRDWIETIDQVLARNQGRVLRVDSLREFVPASEHQIVAVVEVLSKFGSIELLDWLCCNRHGTILFDPNDSDRYCDLCGKTITYGKLKRCPSLRVMKRDQRNTSGELPSFMTAPSAPKVFISYSHDSKEYANRVLELATQLRKDGVDATIDQYVPSPPEGWPLWMERQVEQSDFVLMVFSERYHRRCRGEEMPGIGKGVAWESILISNELYNSPHFNTKFLPAVLDSENRKWIIPRMQGYTNFVLDHFDLERTGGYQNLYRLLTNQPAFAATSLGYVKRVPSITVPNPVREDSPVRIVPSPSSLKETEADRVAPNPTDILILVHGIRDFATPWYSRANRVFRDDEHVKVIGVKYGFFNAINFLAPFDWSQKPYQILVDAYDAAIKRYPNSRISIIAHSFGTFLVARLLEKHPTVKLHRVLFCGSVCKEAFDWQGVLPHIKGVPAVFNECGTTDPWPAMAKALNGRYGAAGRHGFGGGDPTSSYFEGGHSVFLEESHMRNVWRSFVLCGTIHKGNADGSSALLIEVLLTIPFATPFLRLVTVFVWSLCYLTVPLLLLSVVYGSYAWFASDSTTPWSEAEKPATQPLQPGPTNHQTSGSNSPIINASGDVVVNMAPTKPDYVTDHEGGGALLMTEPDFVAFVGSAIDGKGDKIIGRLVNGTPISLLEQKEGNRDDPSPPWARVKVLEGDLRDQTGWILQTVLRKQ